MPELIRYPHQIRIRFEENRILVRLGAKRRFYREGIDSSVKTIVLKEMDQALDLIKPRLLAALLDSEELPDAAVFKNADKAALCLCTIGPDLENKCQELMTAGDALRGFILDTIGSEAVSSTAEQANAWLGQKGRAMGLRPSKPFAPGYKGWDLSGQKLIFGAIPAEEIGVSLSESFMMSPRKSYSFRINYYREICR